MTEIELAWVAGLLEGEGTFGWAHSRKNIRVSCGMTDEDILLRLQSLCGGHISKRHYMDHTPWKPCWVWSLNKRNEVAELLRKIFPLMGSRRSARIHEILQWHDKTPQRQLGLVHGTRHAYTAYKCRCESCKIAGTAYSRQRYANKKSLAVA